MIDWWTYLNRNKSVIDELTIAIQTSLRIELFRRAKNQWVKTAEQPQQTITSFSLRCMCIIEWVMQATLRDSRTEKIKFDHHSTFGFQWKHSVEYVQSAHYLTVPNTMGIQRGTAEGLIYRVWGKRTRRLTDVEADEESDQSQVEGNLPNFCNEDSHSCAGEKGNAISLSFIYKQDGGEGIYYYYRTTRRWERYRELLS